MALIVRRGFILLCLVLALPAVLSAQEARRSLFIVEFTEQSSFSEEQRVVITESLLLRLQNEIDAVDFILNSGGESEGISDYYQYALLNSSDSLLLIQISGAMDMLTADFVLSDALVRSRLASFRLEGVVDAQYRNLFGGFWYEALAQLSEVYSPLKDSATLQVNATSGSFVTITHANVDGSDLTVEVDDNGAAVFQLDIPASYELLLEKEGYYSERQVIFLDESKIVDMSNIQETYDRFYAYGGLQMLSYGRIGAGMLFAGGQWQLGLDAVFYQLGLQPFQDSDWNNPDPGILLSLPLTSLGVSGGLELQLLNWDLPIQFYNEAVLSLRFLTDTKIILDPVFPLELRLEPAVDWQINRHISLLAGLSGTINFMLNTDLADLITPSEGNRYTALTDWLYLASIQPFLGLKVGF